MRRTAQVVVGLVISLLAFGLAFRGANLAEVVQALRGANYFYVLPAVSLSLLGLFFRAQSWRVIMGGLVPYRRVFDVMNMGYLLNNVLPFRLGEFGRAYLISRGRAMSASQALSSIIVERVVDMLMVVVLLAVFLPLVAGLPSARPFAFAASLMGLGALGALVLAARNQQRFERLVAAVLSWPLFRRLPSAWLLARLANFLEGLSVFRDPGRALRVAFWSGSAWAAAGVGAWMLLRAFVPDATVAMGFFVLTILGLGVAVPSLPGSAGVFEAVVVLALSVFSIDASLALSFALVFHASQLALTSTLGSLAMAREGETLTEVARAAQTMLPGAGGAARRQSAGPDAPAVAADAGVER